MIGAKIQQWQGFRAELAAVEAAEHSDINDPCIICLGGSK